MTNNEEKKEQKKSEEIKKRKKLHEGKVERVDSWPEPTEENNKKSDDS